MTPGGILTARADLRDRIDHNEDFRTLQEQVLRQTWANGSTNIPRMFRMLRNQVDIGESYIVSEKFSEVVQQSATVLDSTDVFEQGLMPSESGIVCFTRPLEVVDVRGRTMLAHWLTWGPADGKSVNSFGQTVSRPGTLMMWWNDLSEPDDVAREIHAMSTAERRGVWASQGRWGLVGADHFPYGGRVGPDRVGSEIVEDGNTRAVDATNIRRYAYTFALLCKQTIASHKRQSVGTKHARRMSMPSEVNVVDLRRSVSVGPPTQPSGRTYSSRWVVRGSWQWRACGEALDGAVPYEKGFRRRVYVPWHMKGPEGAPLLPTKERVHAVRR